MLAARFQGVNRSVRHLEILPSSLASRCHAERNEGSRCAARGILRCAQHDRDMIYGVRDSAVGDASVPSPLIRCPRPYSIGLFTFIIASLHRCYSRIVFVCAGSLFDGTHGCQGDVFAPGAGDDLHADGQTCAAHLHFPRRLLYRIA